MVESTAEADFTLTLKVLSGITCLLSILGAGLIIATYVAFGDLRTVARQLLVNLSLADITVAASHFVGLAALRVENYETPYNSDGSGEGVGNYSTEQDTLCKVQGGFTMFGTLASFLWTLALGFYMLMVIVLKRTDVTRYLVFLYYPVCWGVPLTLTLWFGLVKPTYLGFGEGADIGWCYIRVVPDSRGEIDHPTTILAEVLGYELWFYGTLVSLAAIYITMLCCLKYKGIKIKRQTKHFRKSTDLKLVLVPLIFFLLRIWSGIIDIVHYARLNNGESSQDNSGGFYALLLLAGVGDSAQGLANAILFCVFTRQVRNKLLEKVCSHLCCCCPKSYYHRLRTRARRSLLVHEATTQLDGDSVEMLAERQYNNDRDWETSLILDTIAGKYGT